ncbi:hypothetical protein DPMN_066870 [Dreissena polymorpha]|uniref:Uncharacterized protein n=1 Tax=Dreissena polymorpha TaxID=45954 RepID=A0A9D4BT47_DREPO|nr:hypothetical protein DPMN_066870 [Dreissena polymorpha]
MLNWLCSSGIWKVVPDLITDEYAKHATQVDKEIPIIRRDISNILRKFRHFGRMLGVPDIRKKLCRYEQKLCLHDEKDRKNYALKIVAYAANKTTHIQSWFDKISAATENCELNSCSPARNVLSCDHGGSMKSKGSKRPNGGRRRDKSQKGGKQKGRKERKHRNHRRTRHQRKC